MHPLGYHWVLSLSYVQMVLMDYSVNIMYANQINTLGKIHSSVGSVPLENP